MSSDEDDDDDENDDLARCPELDCDGAWISFGGVSTCPRCGTRVLKCKKCGKTEEVGPRVERQEMCEDCKYNEKYFGVEYRSGEVGDPNERGTHRDPGPEDRCVVCAENHELIYFTGTECGELGLDHGEGYYCQSCGPYTPGDG